MKKNILYIIVCFVSMSSIQQAQQGPIAGSFKISNNDTSSLEYLIGKRGNVQTELDKIYKPQWYNFYGYGTSLNDANKIKSVQLQTERNNLDEQISSQQWNEQSFMFRSGYRSIQAALLYLAVIGGLYGTQDYWKNLVSIDGTLTFNQLAIIPLMQMLKLILKTNETVLKNFENPAIVEPIKTISEIIQPEA